MMFKPMPLLSVLSLTSLIILILLGNWQYERYTGKLGKDALDETFIAKTIELEILLDVQGMAQQVYGSADSEPIWRAYAPARVMESGEIVLALVSVTGGAEPFPQTIESFPSQISYTGHLIERHNDKGLFGVEDEPEQDQWYRPDGAGMAKRLGLEVAKPRFAEPLAITIQDRADLSRARVTANPYAYPKPLDPLPPERHFGYALTWWGMAFGLVGVYLAFHHARGRLRFRKA